MDSKYVEKQKWIEKNEEDRVLIGYEIIYARRRQQGVMCK